LPRHTLNLQEKKAHEQRKTMRLRTMLAAKWGGAAAGMKEGDGQRQVAAA
jgi:hypothetical protein